MSRSVQNPKTLTPLINMITPKVQFNSNAKYWVLIAALLSGGMVYLGNSNHRLADTHDALSADIQLLIEYIDIDMNPPRSRGIYEPLIPPPSEVDPWKSMPIIQ